MIGPGEMPFVPIERSVVRPIRDIHHPVTRNNGWSISVPARIQCSAPTVAQRGVAYGMDVIQCDGNDIFAVYMAVREAVERARRGDGPMSRMLKTPPANLTQLARNNGGQFPFLRVLAAIDGRKGAR